MTTPIRGAITVTEDTPEAVRCGVKKLLCKMQEQNRLQMRDIAYILFSNTSDIRSYYPARAARDAGFCKPALFSMQEPEIEGSLRMCIRVLMIVDKKTYARHVYLEGASGLRTDLNPKIVIALDGPAGSGKSTVAKALAQYFNILYLDTGAMYRACALRVLQCGVDPKDSAKVAECVSDIDLSIRYIDGTQHTFLSGKDVSSDIRKNEVSMIASSVSAVREVREKMVEMQRKVAGSMECVLDGRDIGSTVLPDAPYKFFVTADSKVRAKRRYDELLARGESVDFEKLHAEIVQRDRQDETREFSPLVRAKDAVLVDTSDKSIEEVLSFIIDQIQ